MTTHDPYTFAAMWAGISGATLLIIALVAEFRRPAATVAPVRRVIIPAHQQCARLTCGKRWTRSINGWHLCDECATGVENR